MENETILSGYVRYRPVNKTYYLMVNSRRLCTALSKQGTVPTVKVSRNNHFFSVGLNPSGNVFKPRSKELVTCISGNTLLSKKERENLTSNDSKFSFPVKVKINPGEFKLDRYDLYPDEDAAVLARSLSKNGVKIPKRIMTPKAFPHDLEFRHFDSKVIIEITQVRPSEKNHMNFRHQPQGGSIRAHIFDIYRMCVNTALLGKNNLTGFVILHQDWKNYNHIVDLIPELAKINCNIIFTDFNKSWEVDSSNKIMGVLVNE
ncbi:hypothetical protein CL620_03200 [archaeon]|nr:hypothetical protein [archaeon]|tara:strand:- start:184 stop:963 length:780 start_codon:yes stop_codon:yes gene_type:complete